MRWRTYGEGQEITSPVPRGGGDGGEHVGLVHGDDDGSVGEPGDFAGLNVDGAGSDLELLPEGLQDLRARDGAGGGRLCLRGLGEEAEAATAEGTKAEAAPREERGHRRHKGVCPPPQSCRRYRCHAVMRGRTRSGNADKRGREIKGERERKEKSFRV